MKAIIAVLLVLCCVGYVWHLDRQEEAFLQHLHVIQQPTIAAYRDVTMFSIQEALGQFDTIYVKKQIDKQEAVILEAGTPYQIVAEFPDWLLIRLFDDRLLFLNRKPVDTLIEA